MRIKLRNRRAVAAQQEPKTKMLVDMASGPDSTVVSIVWATAGNATFDRDTISEFLCATELGTEMALSPIIFQQRGVEFAIACTVTQEQRRSQSYSAFVLKNNPLRVVMRSDHISIPSSLSHVVGDLLRRIDRSE